jgi:hypothetical protein
MSIADDLSLLTQGAVFLNKKGRTAKLLHVTNTALDAKIQVTHPPQVVYVSDEGDVYNRDVDDFLDKYKFFNVDPDLETRLENLFVFSENDPAFEAVAAVTEQPSPLKVTKPVKSATEIVADVLKTEIKPDADDSLLLPPQQGDEVEAKVAAPAVQVLFNTFRNSIVIAPELRKLSRSLIAYAQEPDLTQSLIVHRLTFALDNELTIPQLQELFRPCDDSADMRNTVDIFEVRTSDSAETIAWTSYIGVFPEYTKQGLYATVMVGTDEVRDTAVGEHDSEVHHGPTEGSETTAPVDESHVINLPEVTVNKEVVAAVMHENIQGFTVLTNPDNLLSQNQERVVVVTQDQYEAISNPQIPYSSMGAKFTPEQTAELGRNIGEPLTLVTRVDPDVNPGAALGDVPGAL